jgi:DNA-binding MarR family transcriptional regulator
MQPLVTTPDSNRYLAYAEWRIRHHRQESVRFFRQTRNRSLIWISVLRGHYAGKPPSLKACMREAACSIGTARTIIFSAVSKGFFELQASPDDSRKKLIHPSAGCIAEYERMVDAFLSLTDVLTSANIGQPAQSQSSQAVKPSTHWHSAYAEWWFMTHPAAGTPTCAEFFQRSRDHSILWTGVMRRHYTNDAPSFHECIKGMTCSKDTARKIISTAVSAGYFEPRATDDDKRKKLIHPSARCVAEYETMVDTLIGQACALIRTANYATSRALLRN